jgi:asparagine synthase (glutamine-hydrolysing)
MNRLSIIDRAHGHQPIENEDRNLAIVFNGEIYNYQVLKNQLEAKGHVFRTQSDTEVVLHLYEEYGPKSVVELNGMFAFAIVDKKNKTLFLARDRFGIKPLLYSNHNGFSFASEARAFRHLPGFEDDLDEQSIADYFSLSYIPTPRSIFKNIRKLEPAHYLLLRAGSRLEKKCYWTPTFCPKIRTASETMEEFLSTMKQSVERQLMSEVPVGVFLSGGLDSTTIAYFLQQNGEIPYKTFSIGFDEKNFDESPLIETFLARYKARNFIAKMSARDVLELIPKVTIALDEPLGFTAYPFYVLAEAAKKEVTVALAGDGGDELFGGYDMYYAHRFLEVYRKVPNFVRNIIERLLLTCTPVSYGKRSLELKIKKFSEAANYSALRGHICWREFLTSDEKQQLLRLNNQTRTDPYPIFKHELEDNSIVEIVDRFMFSDLRYFLQECSLFLADRVGMHHSLEVRVPFLDNEVFNFSSSLPLNWKFRRTTTKYLMRKALNDVLPREIISAPKLGFAPPFGAWISGPLRELFLESFSTKELEKVAIFNPKVAQRMLNDHLEKKADNTRKLMLVFCFLNWHRFVKQSE